VVVMLVRSGFYGLVIGAIAERFVSGARSIKESEVDLTENDVLKEERLSSPFGGDWGASLSRNPCVCGDSWRTRTRSQVARPTNGARSAANGSARPGRPPPLDLDHGGAGGGCCQGRWLPCPRFAR